MIQTHIFQIYFTDIFQDSENFNGFYNISTKEIHVKYFKLKTLFFGVIIIFFFF